ncbi:MAG: hypothetical protein AB1813_12090 [Verrucomicrobiota bacterium]
MKSTSGPVLPNTRLLQIAFLSFVTVNTFAATFTDNNWISMNPNLPGADGDVKAAAADTSGNVYVGGEFAVIGNVVANGIAKWNGSRWSKLGLGMRGKYLNTGWRVNALAISGTDLYSAGSFTSAINSNGTAVTVNSIAKWNGTNWSSLGLGVSGDGDVNALAVSGGDVYAGGNFTTATNSNGAAIAVNRLAKWNGSTWSALGSGVNGTVRALAVSGSDLYVGGSFTTAGGLTVNRIAKWDGTRWLALGSGMEGQFTIGFPVVNALTFLGGELWAGGRFTMAGGVPVHQIAKWNGNTWSDGSQGLGDFGNIVYSLVVSGGALYAGGGFFSGQSFLSGCVARWDGSSWSAVGLGIHKEVLAMAVSGGNVYAGGRFNSTTNEAGQAVTTLRIAQWNGNDWSVPGLAQEGTKFIPSDFSLLGNELYAIGTVATAGVGAAEKFVAKWNGSDWELLGSGFGGINYPSVNALAVIGNDLYAGGSFSTASDNLAANVAKWDGSNWLALESGVGDPFRGHAVNALAVLGTNLFAAGLFDSAGGVPAMCIARWDGISWSSLGTGMGGTYPLVLSLAVLGNDLYAGGFFTIAGGITANRVAKWNGSNWSALGAGVTAAEIGTGPDVSALAVIGNNLYVAGAFTAAGGNSSIKYIARWNGSTWSGLGSGVNAPAYALAVSGSDLYVGGGFGEAGGIPALQIAKWTGSRWSALGSGMAGRPGTYWAVNGLRVIGNDLYVRGAFTIAGGKVSAGIARARISFTPDTLALKVSPGGIPGAHTNTLTFAGVPHYPYIIQYATNLTDSPWFTLSTSAPDPHGIGVAVDAVATGPQRFYRVGYQP